MKSGLPMLAPEGNRPMDAPAYKLIGCPRASATISPLRHD
jgi:hypothetical protein